MLNLTVLQERIGPIKAFHPWVFSRALANIPDGIRPGEPVRLVSEKGDFLANGYFNSYSQIAVRIWGYDKSEEIDGDFFFKRINAAYSLRKKIFESTGTSAYRVVNGENDFLPGLIVDRYADYLVIQFHTRGIEVWKKDIVTALERAIRPKGIYERSDIDVRLIERLNKSKGILAGSVPDLVYITENGFHFLVDLKGGQKTGFFLDQRDKRKEIMKYADNNIVLNSFCYTGGFSVYCLAGGARHVVNVDSSSEALDLAKENIKLNNFNLSRCEFICRDVKDYLRDEKKIFDVIILDPPAFIKDRRKKKQGLIGYRNINEMALRLLADGGIFVTCSCSAHLKFEEFRHILSESGERAGRTLTFLETYTHGMDHLRLVPFTEGEYLKCFFLSSKSF